MTPTNTREQVGELAKALPEEKLASWYEAPENDEAALARGFAMWDTASEEAWDKVERTLGERL
jgi:hypothetical protein